MSSGCSELGCDRKHKARGLCNAHYTVVLRQENGHYKKNREPKPTSCQAMGCYDPIVKASYCGAHHYEFIKKPERIARKNGKALQLKPKLSYTDGLWEFIKQELNLV